jgi:hypothetical protein
MTIGVGIFLIAVGAILRFAVSTVSTHGFGIHTIGDILMLVGALGVVLWLLVWAPWAPRARSRRTVYRREEVPPVYREGTPPVYREGTPPVYREDVPPGYREGAPPRDVPPPPRQYRTGATYIDSSYEDESRN